LGYTSPKGMTLEKLKQINELIMENKLKHCSDCSLEEAHQLCAARPTLFISTTTKRTAKEN